MIFALNAVYGFVGGASSSTGTQRTVTVARGTVQSSVTASGNVSVARSAAANFSTSGTVTSVNVKVGDFVTVGAEARDAGLGRRRGEPGDRQGEPRAGGGDARLDAGRRDRRAAGVERFEPPLGAGSGDDARSSSSKPTRRRSPLRSSSSPTAKKLELSAYVELVGRLVLVVPVQLRVEPVERRVQPVVSDEGSGGAGSNGSSSSGSSDAFRIVDGSGSSGGSTLEWNRIGRRERRLRIFRLRVFDGDVGSSSPLVGTVHRGRVRRRRIDRFDGLNRYGGRRRRRIRPGLTNGRAIVYAALVAPTVTTGQASGVTANSATVAGSVNPGGLATTYSFQYGTSPSNLSSSTPSQSAGSGSGVVPVTAALGGLSSSQSYWFRLVATNSSGTTDGELGLFTTTAAARGRGREHVRDDGAGLVGHLDQRDAERDGEPCRVDTTYDFEYGTSPSSLSSSTPSAAAGSGSTAVPVTAAITGLTPGQTYWFRVVATNSSGTADGALASSRHGDADVGHDGPGDSIGSTTATLNGTVNPGGVDTTVHFVYGTSSTNLSSSTPAIDVGSGSSRDSRHGGVEGAEARARTTGSGSSRRTRRAPRTAR